MCQAPQGSCVNSETQKTRTFRRRKEKEAETFPHQSLIFHEGNIRPGSHEAVWNLKPTSANPRGTRTREALKSLQYTQHLSFEEDEYDSSREILVQAVFSENPRYVGSFKETATEENKSDLIWKCLRVFSCQKKHRRY